MGMQTEARYTCFVDIRIYNAPHILLTLGLFGILGLTYPQNLEEEHRTVAQNTGSGAELVRGVTRLGFECRLETGLPNFGQTS